VTTLSLLPILFIDFAGAVAFVVFSGLALRKSLSLVKKDPESPMAIFLLWLCGSIFALALSRSMGHIIKHLLIFSGNNEIWNELAPYSGSINTIAFIVIASVTLFFNRIEIIMDRMARDKETIEKNSQELLRLNKDIEAVIAERTRAGLALRIAHEVRNPITIIGGMVRRLLNNYPDEDEGKLKLTHILTQSHRLENLVNNFEKVRPEAKKIFAPLDLQAIVEEAVTAVRLEAERKEINLELPSGSASLFFLGNASLMKMSLIHLLRNAITACDRGKVVKIGADLTAAGIRLVISDNGPGIVKDLLEVIFDPYQRLQRQAPGLGIPFVKQIINEHMGTISLESTVGIGTTITIVLPTHLGELNGSASDAFPP